MENINHINHMNHIKIITKGNTDFIEIEVIGGAENLNPYYININNIRYIRRYKDKNNNNACAIFVGNKMFIAKDCFGLENMKPGDEFSIGNVSKVYFTCSEGLVSDKSESKKDSKLESKIESKPDSKYKKLSNGKPNSLSSPDNLPTIYFINHQHTLYIRKYIKNVYQKTQDSDIGFSSNNTKSIAQKDEKGIDKQVQKDSKIDIFAIVTNDERLIPIESF